MLHQNFHQPTLDEDLNIMNTFFPSEKGTETSCQEQNCLSQLDGDHGSHMLPKWPSSFNLPANKQHKNLNTCPPALEISVWFRPYREYSLDCTVQFSTAG